MLALSIDKRAAAFLAKLPQKHAGQVARKIHSLRTDPYPSDSKLLKGIPLHRTDSGEYRIVYRVEDEVVRVYLIGKRNDDDVYRRLDRLAK